MNIGIILRTTTGEGGQRLSGSGHWRTAMDSRDLVVWDRFQNFQSQKTHIQGYALGPERDIKRVANEIPCAISPIGYSEVDWAGTGIEILADLVMRAVGESPLDYLVMATGGSKDLIIPFAQAAALALRWPLVSDIETINVHGANLSAIRWTKEGYELGRLRPPVVMTVEPCPKTDRRGWHAVISKPSGAGLGMLGTSEESAGRIKGMSANPPGSPMQHGALRSLVDLWDRMRKPVWVWGDIDHGTGDFNTGSLELVAEARRWVGSAKAVTVVSLSLPHVGADRAFLDGADAVVTGRLHAIDTIMGGCGDDILDDELACLDVVSDDTFGPDGGGGFGSILPPRLH